MKPSEERVLVPGSIFLLVLKDQMNKICRADKTVMTSLSLALLFPDGAPPKLSWVVSLPLQLHRTSFSFLSLSAATMTSGSVRGRTSAGTKATSPPTHLSICWNDAEEHWKLQMHTHTVRRNHSLSACVCMLGTATHWCTAAATHCSVRPGQQVSVSVRASVLHKKLLIP